MGMSIAGLRQFFSDPSVRIPDRVWSVPSCPCLGPWVGLTRGNCCQILGPCSPCQGKAVLGALVGVGTPSAKKWTNCTGRSGSAPNSLSTSNWTCFLSFSSFCGEASHHCTWFPCCNLRPSMEWQSCLSGWDHGGLGEGDWSWWRCEREGICCHLDPLLPLEWDFLLPDQDCLPCCLASRAWSSSSGPWEHLWLLEDTLASPLSPCRPAQVRHSESSLCSSFIRSLHWA